MHYLVTGAQGFLGSHLVTALRKTGATVTATGRRQEKNVIPCDLSMKSEVIRLVDQVSPDRIIHCAAQVPRTLDEYEDDVSVCSSLQMLDHLLEASSCSVVYISSMTVYGTERERPVVEQDAGDPTSAYGTGKWQGEQRLMSDGRPALAIRIPGLFGPSRQDGLVYNLVYGAKHGTNLQLPTTPILWAAMHVEDAAESVAKLSMSPISKFEAVHVSYRETYSIETLVSLVGALFAKDIDYKVKQPRIQFDLTRAESRSAIPASSLCEALSRLSNEV